MSCFELFFLFSGLKQNTSKCEVAEKGNLKEIKVAICGLQYVDLTKETVQILGIHFSYDKIIQN